MNTSLIFFKCPFKSTPVYKQISFANIFCLPLIFSYPHPVLIQQTFKGRPYRTWLSGSSLIVREGGGFKNQNKTQKPCPLNRIIGRIWNELLLFVYACCWRGMFRFRKNTHWKVKSTKQLNGAPLVYLKPQLYRLIWFIVIIHWDGKSFSI